MPSRQQSTKKRSQGGGRTSNSEPRQQVFSQFSGCNFELSPQQFGLVKQGDQEQSDLQLNFMTVQNNAGIASNQTIETRNKMVELFSAPEGRTFTGPCILVGDEFHIALDDGSLKYGTLGEHELSSMNVEDKGTGAEHHWRSFAHIDGNIVATTEENELWTGKVGSHKVENAVEVPDPEPLSLNDLKAKKKLKISATYDGDDYPYRVSISYALVNKYGPTKRSDPFTFYASIPVEEWHSGQYLQVRGPIPEGKDVKAVEIYYTVDNSSSLLPCGRKDISSTATSWSYNWYGYLDATAMWPVMNLTAPTDNYTKGVKASHIGCIDGRLYFWGTKDKPYRLWIGGNPGNLYSVSSGTGGGFVDVEPDTGQEIRVVTKYKTQSGASIVTMMCDSPNSSKEQRYNLVENTITISNEQSQKSWQAEQVAGAVGCKSFDGALVCEDGLYSISRYGLALVTLTMEYNSQVRTTYVSDPIKPVFTDKNGSILKDAVMLECDGVLYIAFGKGDGHLDNMLFCYDIDLKAWWTVTLDMDEPVLNLVHIDHEGNREGIGIVTPSTVYMLPTTQDDSIDSGADFDVLLQSGELATQQPQQAWIYLSQLEFRFDYFVGEVEVELLCVDQFGRRITVDKVISHDEPQYNLAEWMRVDLRLQSYQLRITGKAKFRMSHFIAKLYTMSSKQGLVWGFDDSESFRTMGDIYPTFKSYNDIRRAVIV